MQRKNSLTLFLVYFEYIIYSRILQDQYVRQTRGYLPDSKVAFIDEIFKANSAILNTLLTILNERLFDNGSQRTKVRYQKARYLYIYCYQQLDITLEGTVCSYSPPYEKVKSQILKFPEILKIIRCPWYAWWVPRTSCPSRRSWTLCTTASCCGSKCSRFVLFPKYPRCLI